MSLVKAPISTGDELSDYSKDTGPFYRMLKTDLKPIQYGKAGFAGEPSQHVGQLLEKAVSLFPDKLCLAVEWPEPAFDPENKEKSLESLPLSEWKTWTYKEMLHASKTAAKGILALDLQKLDTVSILGFNSPFYGFAAYGTILAGGIYNGMYATDTVEQIAYKCKVTGTAMAFVDTQSNLDKFIEVSKNNELLKAVVVWRETEGLEKYADCGIKVLSWEQFMQLGSDLSDGDKLLQERIDNLNPQATCTLIFTSGTTGRPKAVMISHDNLFFMVRHDKSIFNKELFDGVCRNVSYLPLSHIAAFFLDFFGILAVSGHGKFHAELYFVRSYDMKVGGLLPRLQAVRPTFFFGVPRVWEKFAEGIKAKAAKTGLLANIIRFSKTKMLEAQRNKQFGASGEEPWGIGFSRFMIKKIQQKLGLDALAYAGTGAAVMKQETLEFWAGLGIAVRELYGMSENTGGCASNTDIALQWGTVGYAMLGTEVKAFQVDPEDPNKKTPCPQVPVDIFEKGSSLIPEKYHGELCYRGRHIMVGYLANPELGEEHMEEMRKKNESAIDNEGWLHSGDKACICENNMIRITGRYKELIIGAGGENIAPVPIEDDLKRRCEAISNVVMVGNGHKYNVALISLQCQGATGEKPGNNKLAGAALGFGGSQAKTLEEVNKDEVYQKALIEKLKETNANGEVIMNNTYKIQKFALLPHDLSVEGDELTATLKLKRSVVEKKYKDQIDHIYASQGVYIPWKP